MKKPGASSSVTDVLEAKHSECIPSRNGVGSLRLLYIILQQLPESHKKMAIAIKLNDHKNGVPLTDS
jgi:hypothetical protein